MNFYEYILFLLNNYNTYPYYYLIGTIVFIPDYDLIYIKQPKCAGTSFISMLNKYKIKYISWVNPINNPKYLKFIQSIDNEYISKCKIITISRNPYTRVKSAIKYIFNLRKLNYSNIPYNQLFTKEYNGTQISDIHHWIPTNYITNNKNIFTDIYKYENLSNDLTVLFKKYFNIEIQNNNICYDNANHNTTKSPLNNKQLNVLIEHYFKDEFDLFGYNYK